jgi:hypothetical protein
MAGCLDCLVEAGTSTLVGRAGARGIQRRPHPVQTIENIWILQRLTAGREMRAYSVATPLAVAAGLFLFMLWQVN